jgi:outer membrane protein TolC
MFKKTFFISFFQVSILISCFSQDTISLFWCLDKTVQNHPRFGNSAVIEEITSDKINNLQANNLPQFEINGKATYQSDVINIDIPFPGIDIPQAPKDQYKVSLDITQSIYDGGYTKNKKKIEEISEMVDKSQLEIDIRTTKMQVKDLYYKILLIQKNQEIVDITLGQLIENRSVIETGIKNGVLLISDLDILNVEIIRMQLKKLELENSRIASLDILSEKIGVKINPFINLKMTNFSAPENDSVQRVEQVLFDLQSEQLGQSKELIKSRTLPKLYAFGQFGYGNPALNMLKDEFDPYYIVGAGIKWNIWDWNVNTRDREVIGLQQKIIESRKDQFESEINSALTDQKAVIKNHEENLIAYEQILQLRSKITSTAKTQLLQGVIKTLDYITVFNQETLARIQFENENTLLQFSIAKYLELKGEL